MGFSQGRREKIRAPVQRYDAAPKIKFSKKEKVLTSRRRRQCAKEKIFTGGYGFVYNFARILNPNNKTTKMVFIVHGTMQWCSTKF